MTSCLGGAAVCVWTWTLNDQGARKYVAIPDRSTEGMDHRQALVTVVWPLLWAIRHATEAWLCSQKEIACLHKGGITAGKGHTDAAQCLSP